MVKCSWVEGEISHPGNQRIADPQEDKEMTKVDMDMVKEITKVMKELNLTEEQMENIVNIHGGDIKKALITLRNVSKISGLLK